MASRVLEEKTKVRVERGQYYPTLGGTGALVTHTISLANPGVSLDRMRLRVNGSPIQGSYFSTASLSANYGRLLAVYLSAVDTITIKISETTTAGTSVAALNWEVERW